LSQADEESGKSGAERGKSGAAACVGLLLTAFSPRFLRIRGLVGIRPGMDDVMLLEMRHEA